MKKESKFKVEGKILIPIILFAIISVITIYATRSLLPSDYQSLYLKQILWYVLGFGLAYIMMIFGNKFLYNNAYILYFIGVILLILVLLFGKPINNARCWFIIPYIGSFQPSEFMKIFFLSDEIQKKVCKDKSYQIKNSISVYISSKNCKCYH